MLEIKDNKIISSTKIQSFVEKAEMKEILERLELESLQAMKHLMLNAEDVLKIINSIPPHVTLQLIADVMKKADEIKRLEDNKEK